MTAARGASPPADPVPRGLRPHFAAPDRKESTAFFRLRASSRDWSVNTRRPGSPAVAACEPGAAAPRKPGASALATSALIAPAPARGRASASRNPGMGGTDGRAPLATRQRSYW